jgi:hypothetical protein
MEQWKSLLSGRAASSSPLGQTILGKIMTGFVEMMRMTRPGAVKGTLMDKDMRVASFSRGDVEKDHSLGMTAVEMMVPSMLIGSTPSKVTTSGPFTPIRPLPFVIVRPRVETRMTRQRKMKRILVMPVRVARRTI